MANHTVLLLGCDGYTGWPLVSRLTDHGYRVHGIDSLAAREYRGKSVTPIQTHDERAKALNHSGLYSYNTDVDITEYHQLWSILRRYEPDTVVNLAQIPSAPYSMRSLEEAWHTQQNNVQGALNLYWAIHELTLDTHVVQLATMGEYGQYPEGVSIPEGFLDDKRPAPKSPGSLYHASKVNTTVNTLFLSRTWNIPTTEIYQGIVYGVTTEATKNNPQLVTRFDADEAFGTVLNRFTTQAAIGEPLTVYGRGGQKRAMLSLQDCIRCIQLVIENPSGPDAPGEHPYRAVNQFDEAYRVNEIAEMIVEKTGVEITHIENPRKEDESDHFYAPEREVLDTLGYEPARSLEVEFEKTLEVIEQYADRIKESDFYPKTMWNNEATSEAHNE